MATNQNNYFSLIYLRKDVTYLKLYINIQIINFLLMDYKEINYKFCLYIKIYNKYQNSCIASIAIFFIEYYICFCIYIELYSIKN